MTDEFATGYEVEKAAPPFAFRIAVEVTDENQKTIGRINRDGSFYADWDALAKLPRFPEEDDVGPVALWAWVFAKLKAAGVPEVSFERAEEISRVNQE